MQFGKSRFSLKYDHDDDDDSDNPEDFDEDALLQDDEEESKESEKHGDKQSQQYGFEDKVRVSTSELDHIFKTFLDQEKIKVHPNDNRVICENGLVIYFPYKPYQCQIDYILAVIKSLDTGTYAALESPTGTGKTLCLLCATLAWLHHYYQAFKQKADCERRQILYTSRTHSQLAQVKKELLKTPYNPKSVTVASRDN